MNEQIWDVLLDVIGKETSDPVSHTTLMSDLITIFSKSEKYNFEIVPVLNGRNKFMIRLTEK